MRLHTQEMSVDDAAVSAADLEVLRSLPLLRQSPAEQLTSDRFSAVSRLALDATYYVKFYRGNSNWWRFLLGRDRFSMERDNLAYFASLGLATPTLVAHGFRTRCGVLREAVLVTREVPGSCNLLEYIQDRRLYQKGVPGARQILGQLADAMRTLHGQGFYAADIKPRNILVQFETEPEQLYFFDCPRGHQPLSLVFPHRLMKDLAHLYRDLAGGVRSSDLLWAFKRYLGRNRLTNADRKLAYKVLTYYDARRMTEKRKVRQARRAASRA